MMKTDKNDHKNNNHLKVLKIDKNTINNKKY